MENENVDFNIQNYDIDDLEYFFKLDDMPNYTAKDIEVKANEVQSNLLNGGTFNPRLKKGFMEFIEQGKRKLMRGKGGLDTNALTNKTLPITSIVQNNGHMIEEPTEATFIYSDPSQFYKGTLNPLNTRIVTRILNIDTRFRDDLNSTSTDFTINLPMKFYKVASMEVSAIEIPIGFYGISASMGNNFFTLVVDTRAPVVVTIPDGDYTNALLISTLNGVLVALGITDVTFTLDPINHRVTATTTTPSMELVFNLTNTGQPDPNTQLTSKFGYNLGFTKASYIGSFEYTGESLIDTKSNKYLFLSVDDYQQNVNTNSFVSAFQQSFLDNNILARISTRMNYENTVINENELLSDPRQYFGPVDIQRLRIRLYDEYGRTLNMNGVNYSFCLTLKQMYRL
jgi:hypothetical protein